MLRSSLLNDAPSGPALWRSGDAADCKSVYAGSIPAGASRLSNHHSNPPQPKPLPPDEAETSCAPCFRSRKCSFANFRAGIWKPFTAR